MTARERTWPTFFAFDVADYDAGTELFTVEEHGCYLRLLLAQFKSKHLQAVPAAKRDLRSICKGRTPTARVLAKFERVDVFGEEMLRNARMAKEAAIAVREWEKAKERRRRHRHRKRAPPGEEGTRPGTGPGTGPPDGSGDGSRDGSGGRVPGPVRGRWIERERERDPSSLRSDGDPPADVRAGGASSATEQAPARSHPPGGMSWPGDGSGPSPPIDYDDTDPLQRDVAAYCERLAQLEADTAGTGPVEPAAVRQVLQIVSTTPQGAHLSGLRKASRSWLETTLETCRRFEQENYR